MPAPDLAQVTARLRRLADDAEAGDTAAARLVLDAVAAVDLAEGVLTVAEVAVRLAVSTDTVRREIDAGRLATVRVGRSVRIPVRALVRYMLGETDASTAHVPR